MNILMVSMRYFPALVAKSIKDIVYDSATMNQTFIQASALMFQKKRTKAFFVVESCVWGRFLATPQIDSCHSTVAMSI